MPDALFEVEIPHWLFGGLVLGLLKGFLKFAIEDVFFLAFGFPGIAELVFPLASLFREDACGVTDVDVGGGPGRRRVREHHAEFRIHRELRLAAGASHFNRRSGFLRHAGILRQKCPSRITLLIVPNRPGQAGTTHLLDFLLTTLQNFGMAHEFTKSYLKDSVGLFHYYKRLGDRAIEQAPDEALFATLDPESNSIAIIVKHMTG